MTMRPTTASNESDEAKYRGVRKRKWGKWVSEIRLPNSRERIWLGSYDSPEKAARAFDAALYCLRGNNANFNFPDQPPDIPGGTDLHPSQIQAVASHFANSYYANSSSASPSASTSSHVFQDPNVSQSMDFHVSTHESSFYMEDNMNMNMNMNTIPDYGIYPGFDDYFMPVEAPLAVDYGEDQVNYDGVYSHDPCYLWNF